MVVVAVVVEKVEVEDPEQQQAAAGRVSNPRVGKRAKKKKEEEGEGEGEEEEGIPKAPRPPPPQKHCTSWRGGVRERVRTSLPFSSDGHHNKREVSKKQKTSNEFQKQNK